MVEGDALLNLYNVLVQASNVLRIDKDKSLCGIKAESDNVFNVGDSILLNLFQAILGSKEELLVIGNLDYERNTEGFLKPGCEHHWDSVT
ncbi:MAG: hypothetical protein RLZ87_1085 [Armatimonadota bacterium]